MNIANKNCFIMTNKIMSNLFKARCFVTLLTIFQQNGDVLCIADKLLNTKIINVQFTDITTKDTN